MSDQSRERPMWHQGLFWVGVLLIAVAVVLSSLSNHTATSANKKSIEALEAQAATAKQVAAIAKEQAVEAKTREQELRDIVCGVYVPIGNATITGRNSVLGATIVAATHKGALLIGCPGVKK